MLVRVCDPIRAVNKSLTCEEYNGESNTSHRLVNITYRVADPHEHAQRAEALLDHNFFKKQGEKLSTQ